MNYYERHIGDYLKDTAHLSLLQHGIYARLLDVYYTREGSLPEAEALRLIGARSKEERAAASDVLSEFFKLVDGAWSQGRCDAEIARFHDKQEKARRSADARWSESGRNANALRSGDAKRMRTHSEGNATCAPVPSPQTPDTSNQTPKRRGDTPLKPPAWSPPDWLPAEQWANFVEHRKAMRGVPFTDAARDGVVRELARFMAHGHDPAALLETAVTRGWRTVFEPKPNPAGKHAGFSTKDYTAGVTADGSLA